MERTFQVGEGAALDVRIASGKVELSPGQAGQITVTASGSTDDLVIEQRGTTVWVSSDSRRSWISKSVAIGIDKSIFLSIRIPEGTDVDARVASADVECGVATGRLTVNSASGDVRFDQAEDLNVKTASGDVHGSRVNGRVEFVSASGDLVLDAIGGRSELSTASGDIRIGEAGAAIGTSTMSGDIIVRRFDGDHFQAKSMSGSVDIGIPAGTSVDFDATTLSGDIRLPEPTTDTPATSKTLDLKARLVSGDVRIRRV